MTHLEWLRVFAVLALLAPFVYLSTKLYGRTLAGHYQGRHLKVMESVTLGPNQRLALVKASDRVLLVGFGDRSMALLAEFGESEFPESGPAPGLTQTAVRGSTKGQTLGPSGIGEESGENVGGTEGGRSWAGLVQSLESRLKELKTLRTLWRG